MDLLDLQRLIEIDKELNQEYCADNIDRSECHPLGNGVFVVSSIPAVPVQYCGVVDNYCFYFKSRGETWHFVIADSSDDCLSDTPIRINPSLQFNCSGRYSEDKYAAGYMPVEQAEDIIRACVALWKLGRKSGQSQ